MQAASWFDPVEDAELLELLERWTIAFSKSLQVRNGCLPLLTPFLTGVWGSGGCTNNFESDQIENDQQI